MLGELLAERSPEAVVSSPLRRARETAEALAAAAGLETRVDERLAPGGDRRGPSRCARRPRRDGDRGRPPARLQRDRARADRARGLVPDRGLHGVRAVSPPGQRERLRRHGSRRTPRGGDERRRPGRRAEEELRPARGAARDRLRDRRRRGVRAARPERSREDDHDRDPRGLPQARRRRGGGARRSTPSAPGETWRERVGVVLQSSSLYPNLTVRESLARVRRLLREAARRGRGDRDRRPGREGGRALPHALGRPEAAPRPRARARRQPGADLPRRADDGLRPRGAAHGLGDDPQPPLARHDRPAHDPLPRRGRAARRPRRRAP